MNKIFTLILVVVLSGCTANSAMERAMKYQQEYDMEESQCRLNESTMVEYVNCMDSLKKKQNQHRFIENIPWYSSTSDSYRVFFTHDRVRKLEKKYHMVIAEEVDAGRASRVKAELEMVKITNLLYAEEAAKFNQARGIAQQQSNNQFMKSLLLLDIYSKAIERTTPKQQIIIPPRY